MKWLDKRIEEAIIKHMDKFTVGSIDYAHQRDIKILKTVKNIENIYLSTGGDLYIQLEDNEPFKKVKVIKK